MTNFIPNLYKLPVPKTNRKVGGAQVTSTLNKKDLRAMVSALESFGFNVRRGGKQYICQQDGVDILRATPGNRSTYLTRYVEGVKSLVEKSK